VELYYDSTVEPFMRASFEAERVFELLRKAKDAGIDVRIRDTAGWERQMVRETYLKACVGYIRKKHEVTEIFGTGTATGLFFGRQVPALVLFENERAVDVYPHQEAGRMVSIHEFLERVIRSRGATR